MTNEIIRAVSIALNAEFGDDYKIYGEEIKQGLKEPCFFVQCLEPTTELFIGRRYEKTTPLCIQYFPQSRRTPETECNEVAERLMWCLEYITMDGKPYRGTKMKYSIEDDVLNFFVNFDFFVRKVVDSAPMEIMKSDTAPE